MTMQKYSRELFMTAEPCVEAMLVLSEDNAAALL